MSIPYTNQGIMVQYVGETRVLSLPRLCLRGRSLDTIVSQIRRNGVVTFRSHDDPIFLPYPPVQFSSSVQASNSRSTMLRSLEPEKKAKAKRWNSDGNLRVKPNVEASIQIVSSMRKTTRVLKASWRRNLGSSTKINKKFLKLLH
jgi:hypothetical protein